MNLLNMYKERAKVVVTEKYNLLNRLENREQELLNKSNSNMRLFFKYYSEDNEIQIITSTLNDLEIEQKYLVTRLSNSRDSIKSPRERI